MALNINSLREERNKKIENLEKIIDTKLRKQRPDETGTINCDWRVPPEAHEFEEEIARRYAAAGWDVRIHQKYYRYFHDAGDSDGRGDYWADGENKRIKPIPGDPNPTYLKFRGDRIV